MFQLAQEAVASGIDWQGIALVITTIGGVIGTLLGLLGYTGKAKIAKQATKQAVAIVHGVESASNGDVTELTTALNKAGLDLDVDQVRAAQRIYSKHVKARIKQTAMEHNVADLIKDLVDRQTGRLSSEELRKRLKS